MTQKLPFSYWLAVGWTLGAASCLLWLLQLSVALRPSSANDVVQLGAIEALVFVTGVLGVLFVHGKETTLTASLGIRPTHPALFLLAIALGIVAHFPAESVDSLVAKFFPESAADLLAESTLLAAGSSLRLVVVLLVVACVGPLVEELFFRGAIFGALRQSHSLAGTASVTAICFVIGHLNFRKWPALIVVAFALTYLRAASGSLLPSLAMHVVFNAVSVLAFFLGDVSPAKGRSLSVTQGVLGTLGTVAVLLVVRFVANRAPSAQLARAEDTQ